MKLPSVFAAILVISTTTNNGVVFAQSPDRCFCESADNANCPPEAPQTLTVVDQVFCFGGYPGFCSVLFDSFICNWTTDVMGNNDAYPIASITSCDAGCMPLPYDAPEPPAEPAVAVDGQPELLRPKQASPDTPWEELRSTLSSPDILNLPTPVDWKEECLDPMLFQDELPPDPFQIYGYDIGYKPSGVCMVHMSCAYDGCNYYFSGSEVCPPDKPDCWMLNRALSPPFDANNLYEDNMELPAAVLHPNSASDVVRGIEFANQHDIGVTVKVVGHSFFGSSTARGTLLIKMSTNYPQYGIEGSLTECDLFKQVNCNGDEACIAACTLAIARGKRAFLRVGGGELFDTAYRAVFFDWNENNTNKYHFVGGYCGTVSAAGGWVQSGGLSGASMRLHGIGIDQVLHIEMVLPSGTHVRFGPTEWETQQGDQAPKTVQVTGYCNAVPYETDESLWEWTPCDDPTINFEDLWFAVRGGGGGTFGIVTSLYYQLHDKPGEVQSVVALDWNLETRFNTNMEQAAAIIEDYLRFSLRYFYLPETLGNVTELESRSCNSPGLFLNWPVYSKMYCHNSAGTKFIEEWKKYLETECITCEKYGDDQELMAALDSLFFVEEEYPSQGYVTVMEDGPYAGRLQDDSGILMYPMTGLGLDHVPLYTLENYFDDLITILVEEAGTRTENRFYLMGGAVPSSSDQMDSLGPMRRDAAFSRISQQPSSFGGNADLYERFYQLVWRDVDTTTSDFPGILCHNHATNEAIGPLKSDWTKPCPSLLEVSQAEREELCVSQAESFWGTANVALLEDIKKSVDPTNMFVCNAGILAATPYNKSELLNPPPHLTDPTGGCAETAGCFDETGCSFLDQSTQMWSGVYAPCIEAIECAVFFPDSPCFFNNSMVSPVVCTEDVFECDDGSFVSRDEMNNCEFKECPSSIVCTEDVFECDDGSFVSRDEMNNCEFEECPSSIVCTEDVFECDDGSFVSRDGMNNCEFEECPSSLVCTEDVFECADGSFVSRDAENDCQFPECPTLAQDDGEVNMEDDGELPWADSNEDSTTVSSADGGCLSIRKYAVAFLFFVGFFLV